MFEVTFDSNKPMEMQFRNGSGGAVNSVNGQTGDVLLGSGDIAYSDSESYPAGSVGAEVSDLKSNFNDMVEDTMDATPTGSYYNFSDYIGKPLFGANGMFSGAGGTFDIDISSLDLSGKTISTYIWIDALTSYVPGSITEVQLDADGQQIYPTSGYHYVAHPMTILPECKTIRLLATPDSYNNWSTAIITHAQLYEDGNTKVNYNVNYSVRGMVTQSDFNGVKTAIDLEIVNASTNLIDNRGMAGKTPAKLFGFASGNYVAYIPLVWGENTAEGSFRGYFVLNDGTSDQTNLTAIQLTICDEDKTALTGNLTQAMFNVNALNIPPTAKYIKLTMYNWFSYTIVKFGLCKSDYSIYTEETVSTRLNSIETGMTALSETSEEHSNILDDISQPVYNGSYFDFSNYVGKGLFGANSLFTGSGATFDIDISGLGLTGKYISTFLWKDDDTSYITGYITESQLDADGQQIYPTSGYHYVGNPVQVRDGCVTIRLTATPNAYNNWGSAELTHAQLWTSGSEKLDFNISYKPNEANAWAGKKWVSYGDSITQLGTYQPFVANKVGLSVVNAGLGGSSVADGNDQSIASFTDSTRISALPSDADVVTIMGGTNDFNMTNSGAGSPLGSLPTSATFDTTTFIGALCQTVKLIQTQCPNALIIICGNIGGRGPSGSVVGYNFRNSHGLTSSDYAKAAKSVAEYMGIPYIATDECGINPFNRLSYITDSVHPNPTGAELISRPIIAYFETNQPN